MKTKMVGTLMIAAGLLGATALNAKADGVAVSPMIQVGGGMETASGRSGTNILLRFEAAVGTGGNPCTFKDAICQYKQTQMLIMHVDGEMAVNPGQTDTDAEKLPYMNIRFTPLDIPVNPQRSQEVVEWIGRYGIDSSFHIAALPAQVKVTRQLGEKLSVRVTAIGLNWQVQAFPTQVLGIYARAAADLIGYQYLNTEAYKGHGFNLGEARGELGLIFAPSESFVVRATGGTAYGLGFTDASAGKIAGDLEIYGQLTVSVSRLVDVFGRISNRRFTVNPNGDESGVTTTSTQITSGVNVKLDWL